MGSIHTFGGLYRLGPGIHFHDGAQVHGIHVLARPRHNLLNDEPVCPFRWMVWIPKCVDVSVWAKVRCQGAEPKPVVGSLTATCDLGRHKTCLSHQRVKLE